MPLVTFFVTNPGSFYQMLLVIDLVDLGLRGEHCNYYFVQNSIERLENPLHRQRYC